MTIAILSLLLLVCLGQKREDGVGVHTYIGGVVFFLSIMASCSTVWLVADITR